MTDLNRKYYVLATAARNEESYIESLIESVVSQTLLPRHWVIVSDGSTDRTDDIVTGYATKYGFIHLHRISEDHPRNFAAQANAINAGFALVQNLEYDFIGNLDADISLPSSYFEDLLVKFQESPNLGLGGGYLYEENDGTYKLRAGTSPNSVPHGIQLFRRECLTAIGGRYLPLPYGAPDSHAEVTARMKGWSIRAFPDVKARHHRSAGGADGRLRYCFRQGLMDHSLGYHPIVETLRILVRMPRKPYVIGALLRYYSFLVSYVRREKRPVSDEFMNYMRAEHWARIRHFVRHDPGGTRRFSAEIGE